MVIYTGTYIPYEFANKYECLKYVEERCGNIKRSVRLVEKDTEHITLRCPVSGAYIDVLGTEQEVNWIDDQLRLRKMYRP